MSLATITLDIDPFIDIGPLEIAWHGLMTAVGILVGGVMARCWARERGLNPEEIAPLLIAVALGGIVGARVLFLIQDGAIAQPGEWLGSTGFSFYGAIVLAPLAAAAYMRWARLELSYIDALAAGFPLGMAVGRIGDVINGEHTGPASDLPWAIQWPHPDALAPTPDLAYHPGGLYEVVLALAMFAVIWPLRHRFRRPTMLLWAVIGSYAVGRFVMFFWRSDTTDAFLGLDRAHYESLALLAVAAAGAYLAARTGPGPGRPSGRAPRPSREAAGARS